MTKTGETLDLFPSPHPLTPPQNEEDRITWLRLLRSRRVGISTFYRLIKTFGSAGAALDALPDIASQAGVKSYQACPLSLVEEEMRRARRAGARMICFGDATYPRLLMTIPEPPPLLWVMGDETLLHRRSIAIVGARNASSLGLRTARKFANDLGKAGQVVVSGLARGIDACAHDAALMTGTIAVLPGGVDVPYPTQNAELARKIMKQGVLISEAPMGMTPHARHFVSRNRIISGLSRAVLVVEAAQKSGSMITAEQALEQGREIFAVPGHPFDRAAAGGNILIRDGATLARYAGDILEALHDQHLDEERPTCEAANPDDPAPSKMQQTLLGDIPSPSAPPRSSADLALLHQDILRRLAHAPLSQDDLIRDLDLSPQDLAAEIVAMELDGLIARDLAGRLTRPN